MTDSASDLIDRAAAYGDGVFETIAIRDGRPRFWTEHLERLTTGCLRLGLECPSAAELSQLLDAELHSNAEIAEFATARLVVAAAATPRGYARIKGGATVVSINMFAGQAMAKQRVEEGVTARLCNLRLAIQPALAGIKSLNRLEQVLARSEWDDADIFEGLTLDTDGRLICGTMSNVFLVNDSILQTPAITRCGVSGIMRSKVLQRLQDSQISSEVRDIYVDELQTATEVFLTNSQFGVLPVTRIDEMRFDVGRITRQAQALMGADGVPECQA